MALRLLANWDTARHPDAYRKISSGPDFHALVAKGELDTEEQLNCLVKDELVNRLIGLNSKVNLLSPDFIPSEAERAAVQEQRGGLYADIIHHRAKGHDGKPCPAARNTRY